MKRFASAWLPDDETDEALKSGGLRYQHHKLMAALPYVRGHRVAVDIGAHCGLWSHQLGHFFDTVECFEPLAIHAECWRKNAGWKLSCHLHEVALGNVSGTVGISVKPGLSGRSHVDGAGNWPIRRLDEYQFRDVDLIKIDVEGYEYFVARGGEETISRNRPVMIVEQKPKHALRYGVSDTAARDYLVALGAVVRHEISGDYIMTFPELPG